jgi:hypothetical protein
MPRRRSSQEVVLSELQSTRKARKAEPAAPALTPLRTCEHAAVEAHADDTFRYRCTACDTLLVSKPEGAAFVDDMGGPCCTECGGPNALNAANKICIACEDRLRTVDVPPTSSAQSAADTFAAKVQALLELARQGEDAVAEALRSGRVKVTLPRTASAPTEATVVRHPTAGLVARNKAAGLELARDIPRYGRLCWQLNKQVFGDIRRRVLCEPLSSLLLFGIHAQLGDFGFKLVVS